MSSNKNAQVPDIKYKTELCRTWIEQNFCPYMEKCRFAHGKTDLHDKIIFGKNYKQKDCKSFHTKGFCPYGPRCLFRHDERKFSELNRPFYKYALESNFENLFFGINLKKKKNVEEEFLNKNIDIPEILKIAANSVNTIGNGNLSNGNLDNSSFCASSKNSELENSQILIPSSGLIKRTKFYSPHLNIFKKIHQLDSFSFDSTDVDIELENSDCNFIGNGIGNNKGNYGLFTNFNFNTSPKNINYPWSSTLNSNGKVSNLYVSSLASRNGSSDNRKFDFSNSANFNSQNNNNNNNFAFNCQNNFPNFRNDGPNGANGTMINNNNLPNSFSGNTNFKNNNSVNSKSNAIPNSNIGNSLHNNNYTNNPMLKNLNRLQQNNSNLNNINNNLKYSLYLKDTNKSSLKNNHFNYYSKTNNNESFGNTENINPNIGIDNTNQERKINKLILFSNCKKLGSTSNFNEINNYKHCLQQNTFLDNNCSDNYNKIFANPNYSNLDFLCGSDSPDKADNFSNFSILSTENSNFKEENVPNSFINECENFDCINNNNNLNQDENFKDSKNIFSGNNVYCICNENPGIINNKNLNDTDKINKETIFENFFKIEKNSNLKNNQNPTQVMKNTNSNIQLDYYPNETRLQSIYSSNDLEEIMKMNSEINLTKKTTNTKQSGELGYFKKSQIKENENANFLSSNNSNNNFDFYSIY